MLELFGHFHPVIVHLPIGVLLVALLFQWISRKEKYQSLKAAIPLVLLWGSVAAIIACITGYFLSISDDYDQNLVNWHMWMAIGVVLVSLVLYSKEVNPKVEVSKGWLSIGLFLLLMATGHFGGSLTHGSDYLSKPFLKIFSADTSANTAITPLQNVQEAVAYTNVIQPILRTKCYSCHNENKQKGKLRMDDPALLLKGGKHGSIIDVKEVDSSEMIRRILLPVDNEHHMPPKEKPQASEQQVHLLRWWISNGADFKKKVKELPQSEKIKPVLIALQVPEHKKEPGTDLPAVAVERGDDRIIDQLRRRGILVLPVSQTHHYLSVMLPGGLTPEKQDLELIRRLSKQIVSLRLNETSISDDAISLLGQLSNLRKLNLSGSNISDKGLSQLSRLSDLQYLNLVGTKVTARGIMQLQNLQKLESLYLYQTKVQPADMKALQSAFPKTEIDLGNYVVPLLETDTTQVTVRTAK